MNDLLKYWVTMLIGNYAETYNILSTVYFIKIKQNTVGILEHFSV